MTQTSIFITVPTHQRPQTVQIGPFEYGQRAEEWVDRIRNHCTPLANASLTIDRYRSDQPSIDPATIPVGAVNIARHMDIWDRSTRHGHDVVDLRTLLICELGAERAAEVWGEALELRDALTADQEPYLPEIERERIVARINEELAATEGERPDGDTAGHVAYDTVMDELRKRCNGDNPDSPAGRVMRALLEVFGTLYMLEGMAGDKGTVPFAANVQRAAKMIEDTRALLTEMLIFGSVSIEYSLAQAGLAVVSVDDFEDGTPEVAMVVRRIRKARGEDPR